MWRCEEELILKTHPSNVTCLLVNYFKRLKAHQILPQFEDEEEAAFLQRTSPQASPLAIEESKESRLHQADTVVTSLLEMLNTSPSSKKVESQGAFEWEPLSQRILNQAMTVFISEF